MSSEAQKLKAIDSINRMVYNNISLSSGSKTGFALRFLKKSVFDPINTQQPNAPKITVLFSDGLFEDDVEQGVAELRGDNVELFALSTSSQANYDNLMRVSGQANLIEFDEIFNRINAISVKKCNANVFRFIENYVED